MSTEWNGLFDDPAETDPPRERPPVPRAGRRRLRTAVRNQVEMQCLALDDLLPQDHEARIVWDWVCALDLSELVERVQAVEGGPGQAPADPRIPMTLWLYATLRGVGSARELARRCESDIAFRWILGGVSTNYHTLSDFRTAHVELLERLLTDSVAALLSEGLVTLDRVAQDGMRVRASAGAASFHRGPTLEEALALAEEQLRALEEERESDPGAGRTRIEAARERAARERGERLRSVLDQLPEIAAKKRKAGKRDQARCSSTDPDARVMKTADGGFRPAYNVQFATTTGTQIVTGVDVVNSGGDQGQMAPMVAQHKRCYGHVPREMLVDGGYVKKQDIEAVSPPIDDDGNPRDERGTLVFAPVMPSKDGRDPHTPRADDGPAVAEWRRRMATDEAKQVYKERAATAECVNAIARNRGLWQFAVRGLQKVRAVALWYALAHNLRRGVGLRTAAAAVG